MHSQYGILHVVGRCVMVHHGITQDFGHSFNTQLRYVAVVSAVEHTKQRLVTVESQLLQYADAQPAWHTTDVSTCSIK